MENREMGTSQLASRKSGYQLIAHQVTVVGAELKNVVIANRLVANLPVASGP